MTEAAGKPERDILHDKRPHHDLIERILLEQHYAGKDTGYTLETADKIATKLAEAYSQSGAGPTRVEYRHHGGGGLCESHTGGPHKIEQGCKNWRPVASGAGSPEETKPEREIIICPSCHFSFELGEERSDLCIRCQRARDYFSKLATSEQICPTCKVDIRCVHGLLFTETCVSCEGDGGAASSSQSAEPTECPMCHTDVRDMPQVGNLTTLGWVNDSEHGTMVCPSVWHDQDKYIDVAESAPGPPSQPRLTFTNFHLMCECGEPLGNHNGYDCPESNKPRSKFRLKAGGGSTGERSEPSQDAKLDQQLWSDNPDAEVRIRRRIEPHRIKDLRFGLNLVIEKTKYDEYGTFESVRERIIALCQEVLETDARAALAEGSRTQGRESK